MPAPRPETLCLCLTQSGLLDDLRLWLSGLGCVILASGLLDRPGAEDRPLELLGHPRIQALAGQSGSGVQLAMQVGRNPSHELTGKRLVRGLASLLAEFEVVIDRLPEGFHQRGDAVSLERDHVPRVDDFTVKNAGLGPDSFSADLIRVLFIRVQKELSERSRFHTDK